MIATIWEKYFFWDVIKKTFFFLSIFYLLYCLIDYASHAASFHRIQSQSLWQQILLHYGCELSNRLNILLPFAFLVASIRNLTTLNMQNELIALLSSGVSLRTLVRPFVLVGLLFSLLLYFNTELILPYAMKHLRAFENARSYAKHQKLRESGVQHLVLKDGSTLIFQGYHPEKKQFFDLFWIKNINEIYRIKFLQLSQDFKEPVGHFVDTISRNKRGEMFVSATATSRSFEEMKFNAESLFDRSAPIEDLALTELFMKAPKQLHAKSEKEAEFLSTFYYKIFMAWLPLLVIVGVTPWCLTFSRNFSPFLVYAISIFALFAFDLIMNSAVVLAERQILPIFTTIAAPFLVISGLIFFQYRKQIS